MDYIHLLADRILCIFLDQSRNLIKSLRADDRFDTMEQRQFQTVQLTSLHQRLGATLLRNQPSIESRSRLESILGCQRAIDQNQNNQQKNLAILCFSKG